MLAFEAAGVSVREEGGTIADGLGRSSVSRERLNRASPWRTFRWYYGQRHFSGMYWFATMSDRVVYESRLELARLLSADFDQSQPIKAQPFLFKARIAGQVKRRRSVANCRAVSNRVRPLAGRNSRAG